MRLIRMIIRQQRLPLALLVLLSGIVTALAVPSYGTTYTSAAARIAAVANAKANAASTLMYGVLPDPGRPGQIAVWEFGSLTCLTAAIAGSLLAVRLSRRAEDSGFIELIRSCGVGPGRPEAAALVVLVGASALLGLATGAGLLRLTSITLQDAASYGASVAVTFVIAATATMAVGQLLANAHQAQLAGGVLVAAAFLARAMADTRGWTWLGHLSALSIMTRVSPATDNDITPLLVATGTSLLLAATTVFAARRRDLGVGLLPSRATARRPLRLRSVLGLDRVLTARCTVIWAVTCSAVTALLVAMGVSTVKTARESGIQGGFLGSQFGGEDPSRAFLRYVGVIAALLASACAVLLVTRYQHRRVPPTRLPRGARRRRRCPRARRGVRRLRLGRQLQSGRGPQRRRARRARPVARRHGAHRDRCARRGDQPTACPGSLAPWLPGCPSASAHSSPSSASSSTYQAGSSTPAFTVSQGNGTAYGSSCWA